MAGDVVALMRYLGHDRFSVVGHDRGALVAFRTAMDHPDAVKRLAVMDGLPVIEHLERLNEAFARIWWHWWFLGQTDKPAASRQTAGLAPSAWRVRVPDGNVRKPSGPFGLTSDTHSDWDPSAASTHTRRYDRGREYLATERYPLG